MAHPDRGPAHLAASWRRLAPVTSALAAFVCVGCATPPSPPVSVEGYVVPSGLPAPTHVENVTERTAPSDAGMLVWLTPSPSEAWSDRGAPVARDPDLRLVAPSAGVGTSNAADAPNPPPPTLETFAADPSVRAVVANRPVRTANAGGDPLLARQWHLTADPDPRWDVVTSPPPNAGAERVTLAVIDTGIAADPGRPGAYHPDLACGTVLEGATFTQRDGAIHAVPGAVEPPGRHASFHGTHVAGIAGACPDNGLGGRGVDPALRLLPIRIFDDEGGATLASLLAAVRWAVGDDVPGAPSNPTPADVVSISLEADGDCRGADAPLADAFADVARRGVIVVAAAGNDAAPEPALPAACPTVLAVGATDDVGRVTDYSGRGADVYAPGGTAERGVLSTFATPEGTPTYAALHGTSMATPYVAAWIARARATRDGLDVAGVHAALHASSDVTYAACRPGRPSAGACRAPVLHPARFAATVPTDATDGPPLLLHVADRSTAAATARLDVWNVGADAVRIDDPTPDGPFVAIERFGPARIPPGASTTFLVSVDLEGVRTAGRAGRHRIDLTIAGGRGTRSTTLDLTSDRDAPPPATTV
ncbi:MAG: S8 family serine peptidase, partial [Trueperaceae bacterium]|nr:S8 family serine peptidase [Trueperaceae bacterium]